ncbi:MAG: hypothetical protein R3F35_07670 [Myxococcota bacterium]
MRQGWIVSAALVVGVFALYGQVAGHELVDFDDYIYLRDNPWLRDPLDLAWLRRALLEPYAAYWIPLTWLSYRLDFALFGDAPAATLLVNVALHAANSVLVFRVFARATGRLARSAFVAAAFAFHPLHVESVAWATERKDVLSTFFFLAGVGCWIALHGPPRSVGNTGRIGSTNAAGRSFSRAGLHRARATVLEVGVAACLALGLLAKPMLVTFPLALLILDFWPLGRFGSIVPREGAVGPASGAADAVDLDLRRIRRLVIEKLPLFAMAAGSALVVLSTQRAMGGMGFTADRSLADRVGQALVAWNVYLAKTFWPSGLSAFHPLPREGPSSGTVLLSTLVLLAISAVAIREAKRRPWLLAGWLWFVVNLLPVIGLVGVGMQAWAERWMYVPLIGLAWIAAWGAGELAEGARSRRRAAIQLRVLVLLATIVVGAWIGASHRQIGTWRDTRSLFTHALEVDPDNWYAHHRLAVWHRQRGDLEGAERFYVASLVSLPGQARVQGELADVVSARGESGLAERLYANVARTGLGDRRADLRLGRIFLAAGRDAEAVVLLERALRDRPRDAALGGELAAARARVAANRVLSGGIEGVDPRSTADRSR